MRVSELIELLKTHIDEYGDSNAQVDAHGSWIPVISVAHFHGRALIKHEPFKLWNGK